ncbi:general secretion pathway protein GspC [Desulfosarcina widdelii]|uniref:General secretion pathway protein GspC n=1 Tax=Desulfosarcina widdelii TaxID=947919 RepID=A0A5K7YWW8_9BACT|nr:type II secretion system protein GspC [Desulfosarcina widdelii]BBO72820.1 general secretion pathway protein GspC [Desulfosarcina widdelii]
MIPKIVFILINLACITLSSYMVVDGVYGNLAGRLSATPQRIVQKAYSVDDTDVSRRPLSAYKNVVERDLFDTRADAAPAARKVDTSTLEETKLNLKLWGTVIGGDDGEYAVIEDVKSREQNLYRVGDAVQTATVKGIFREKVVLSVNGQDEILQMEEFESGKRTFKPGGLPARGPVAGTGATRAQRISLRRSYLEQSMQDMASLMTQVKIQPHMEDGVPAGLALSSIKPNSIFRRMGLRNGDVIVGVDGSEISTVDDALKMVDSLKSSSNLSLQLKRRGREKNIEYRIR